MISVQRPRRVRRVHGVIISASSESAMNSVTTPVQNEISSPSEQRTETNEANSIQRSGRGRVRRVREGIPDSSVETDNYSHLEQSAHNHGGRRTSDAAQETDLSQLHSVAGDVATTDITSINFGFSTDNTEFPDLNFTLSDDVDELVVDNGGQVLLVNDEHTSVIEEILEIEDNLAHRMLPSSSTSVHTYDTILTSPIEGQLEIVSGSSVKDPTRLNNCMKIRRFLLWCRTRRSHYLPAGRRQFLLIPWFLLRHCQNFLSSTCRR